MDNGWEDSAAAWIADQGAHGDFGRRCVLDRPMQARVRAFAQGRALDVGCGEGRFCRWMRAEGIAAVGIEPTPSLLAQARRLDPRGDYRAGRAEALEIADDSVDLVVFYLTLIDIEDMRAAIAEAARVLRPGGRVLAANLQPYQTASSEFTKHPGGGRQMVMRRYLEEFDAWYSWRGINIRNWHRPLSAYMTAFLAAGMELLAFEEPRARDGTAGERARYDDAPYFYLMEWGKR